MPTCATTTRARIRPRLTRPTSAASTRCTPTWSTAAAKRCCARGYPRTDIRVARAMDICYYGQVREQLASVPDGPVTRASLAATVARFHDKHHTRRRLLGAGVSDSHRPLAPDRHRQCRAADDARGFHVPRAMRPGPSRVAGRPTSKKPADSLQWPSTTASGSAPVTCSTVPALSRSA